MPNSSPLSIASATCPPRPEGAAGRFQWRPSRGVPAAVLLLGVLAAAGCLFSDLPAPLAWPVALAAVACAIRSARRERRRARLGLVIAADGAVRIDGRVVEDFGVDWRGPLAVMAWRGADGRVRRRLWLPDTLPAPARRELRLALMRARPARIPGSMAP